MKNNIMEIAKSASRHATSSITTIEIIQTPSPRQPLVLKKNGRVTITVYDEDPKACKEMLIKALLKTFCKSCKKLPDSNPNHIKFRVY